MSKEASRCSSLPCVGVDITFSQGVTLSMGNYEFVRFDFSITAKGIPPQDTDKALALLRHDVKTQLEHECKKVKVNLNPKFIGHDTEQST
jgi:hypothetical protein